MVICGFLLVQQCGGCSNASLLIPHLLDGPQVTC